MHTQRAKMEVTCTIDTWCCIVVADVRVEERRRTAGNKNLIRFTAYTTKKNRQGVSDVIILLMYSELSLSGDAPIQYNAHYVPMYDIRVALTYYIIMRRSGQIRIVCVSGTKMCVGTNGAQRVHRERESERVVIV